MVNSLNKATIYDLRNGRQVKQFQDRELRGATMYQNRLAIGFASKLCFYDATDLACGVDDFLHQLPATLRLAHLEMNHEGAVGMDPTYHVIGRAVF